MANVLLPGVKAPAYKLVAPKGAPATARWGGAAKPAGNWQGIGGGWYVPAKASAPPSARPAATTDPNLAGQYSNPLYRPLQTLYGKPLANAVQQLTNLQYDPAIKQLTQQIGQNAQQGAAAQQATAGYFGQLLPFAQRSAQQVRDIGQGLNTTLQNIGASAQAALGQAGQQANVPALQQADAQGLGGGATAQLAAQIAGLKGLAAARAQSSQGLGAQLGANAATLAAQNLGTYALRGQERLGQIAQATRLAAEPIQQKLAAQQVAKSNAYGTNLQAIRQQQFNNLVAMQGLNIKQSDIAQTAATAAANRQQTAASAAATRAQQKMESDRTYQLNLKKYGADQAKDRYQRQHQIGPYAPPKSATGGGGGGATKLLSAASNNAYWRQVNYGLSLIGPAKQHGLSNQQILDALGQHLSALQAQAALELWTYHYISPATASQLHNAGVRGGSYGGQAIRVGSGITPFTYYGSGAASATRT